MMIAMKWFALIGREKAICLAELASALPQAKFDHFGSIVIGDGVEPDWSQLGGIVRAGRIVNAAPLNERDIVSTAVDTLFSPNQTGKMNVGLSSNILAGAKLNHLGRHIKNEYWQNHDRKLRIVYPPKGSLLNAGHLTGSKLTIAPNAELFIIQISSGWQIGRTTWQQDIAAYRTRDRERPARDARIGMLPPKLAQTMLNLAGVNSTSHVHDPFCGSGVILCEAVLKGCAVSGSDTAEAMVQAARTNLDWLAERYGLPPNQSDIFLADARDLILPNSTTHVVSEGYLGNPDLRSAARQRLVEEADSALSLYRAFFKHLTSFPKPLTIVFALPVWFWRDETTPIHVPILDDLPDMGYTVEKFAPDAALRLVYRRPHQTVGRAIIKLKKG